MLTRRQLSVYGFTIGLAFACFGGTVRGADDSELKAQSEDAANKASQGETVLKAEIAKNLDEIDKLKKGMEENGCSGGQPPESCPQDQEKINALKSKNVDLAKNVQQLEASRLSAQQRVDSLNEPKPDGQGKQASAGAAKGGGAGGGEKKGGAMPMMPPAPSPSKSDSNKDSSNDSDKQAQQKKDDQLQQQISDLSKKDTSSQPAQPASTNSNSSNDQFAALMNKYTNDSSSSNPTSADTSSTDTTTPTQVADPTTAAIQKQIADLQASGKMPSVGSSDGLNVSSEDKASNSTSSSSGKQTRAQILSSGGGSDGAGLGGSAGSRSLGSSVSASLSR